MAEESFSSVLNGVPDPMGGFGAPIPKTPAEMEERKSAWREALDKINSDPNILRALMVTGFSLMQPGANFGSSALRGMATYEAGEQAQLQQQAKQFEQERLLRKDAEASQLSQSQLQTQELNRQNLSQQMDFRAQGQPFELDEKRMRLEQIKAQIKNLDADNRRGDAGIALQRERLQLEREMKDADRALKERGLTLQELDLHERRRLDDERKRSVGGGGSGKMTDLQRSVEAIMQSPDILALPEGERYAAALDVYARTTRGAPTTLKQEGTAAAAQQKAKDTFVAWSKAAPEEREMAFMLNPDLRVLYMRGEELAGGTSAPASGAAPTRKPISAAEIRERMGAK